MLPNYFAHLQNPQAQPVKEQRVNTIPSLPNNKPIVKVIVVGSGISGLATAARLQNYNDDQNVHFQVTILEAKNYVGGRLLTDSETSLDFGASFFHDSSTAPQFQKVLNHAGVSLVPLDFWNVNYYYSNGKYLNLNYLEFNMSMKRLLNSVYDYAYKQVKKASPNEPVPLNIPFEQALKHYKCHNEDLLNAQVFQTFVETALDFGLKANHLSSYAVNPLEEEKVEDMDLMLKCGYSKLVQYMQQGLDIRLGTVVTKIDTSDKKQTHVYTLCGQKFDCDYVVVTVPLGVLKANMIQFVPELPSKKQEAINGLVMGNFGKIILEFPSVFWDKDKPVIGLVPADAKESPQEEQMCHLFVNAYAISGKSVLMGFVADELCRFMENCPDYETVKEIAMRSLRLIYGDKVVEPTRVLKSPWGIDPFTRGSYSAIPPNGEHTNVNAPYTAHGAYISGENQASKILADANEKFV